MFCTVSNHILIWDTALLLRYKSKPNIKKDILVLSLYLISE